MNCNYRHFSVRSSNKMMLKLLLVTITVISGECAAYHLGRIVGGQDADINDYPYQVSVQLRGHHSCGGSIVAPMKVLSAAHCTLSGTLKDHTIRTNTSVRETGGIVYTVVNICNHPKYDPVTFNNDVTVITVSSSLQYDVVLHAIELIPEGQEVVDGTVGVVTGWGLTGNGEERARHLQALTMPKVNDNLCKKIFGNYKPEMICFGYYQQNINICSSDSGGPLVVDNQQVGIVSYGMARCGYPAPSVFAKVSQLRYHIDSCMKYD